MKKHTLLPVLVASLLCLGAVAFTSCVGGGTPTDTTPDTVADSQADTTPADSGETTADTLTESTPESLPESMPESETTAETKAESVPETEAVTAPPRHDYMGTEVLPDVSIESSDYKDLALTLPADLQITDEAVMDYINGICFQYRTLSHNGDKMTDQPMKIGDDAYIYYKGMVDGVEFEGGSNWDDASPYGLGLGSGAFIPGFEEGLVGVIPANATKEKPAEVHVTFPENYSADLAGKDAVFYVAVEYAVQYDLPVYNRDFVENTLLYEAEKEFYASDRAYLNEFEAFVRTYMESEIASDVENAKITALWDHLVGTIECRNLAQMELDYYYNGFMDDIQYAYDYYKAYGGDEFLKEYPTLDVFAAAYIGVEEGKDWKAELLTYAEQQVKRDMIIHAIAEIEGMETVTEEEFKAELKSLVEYYQGYMTEAQILESMGEASIRETILADRMQEWLLNMVTFTYETVSE